MAEISSVSYGNRLHMFGLGSNFDTQSMVDFELQVLTMKDAPFLAQLEYYQQEKNVWNDVLSKVKNLTKVTDGLNDIGLANKKTEYSQEGFFTVTAGPSAFETSYEVEVIQIASKHKLLGTNMGSSTTALGYDSTVQINGQDLVLTPNMTLEGIRDAVNSGGYGIKASIIENTLVFTSGTMGVSGQINLTDNFADGLSGTNVFESLGILTSTGTYANEMDEAKDAIMKVEGVQVQRSTNEISDVISGVTFSLVKETTSPLTFTIKDDKQVVLDKTDEFVKEFNKIITMLNEYTKKEAILQGKSAATTVRRELGRFLQKPTDSSLFAFNMGLEMNKIAKDGTIVFDKTKLSEEYEKNPDEVMKFLNGPNGIITQLYDKLSDITGETGTLKSKISGVDKTIERLETQLDRNAESYERRKESIIQKYSMLEGMLSSITAQSDYIMAQIGAWNSGQK